MAHVSPIFAGVDIIRSAGRIPRAYVYAALDENQTFLALGCGDKNEVLAYLGGQSAAYVTINAPQRPKTKPSREGAVQQYGLLDLIPKQKAGIRACEHSLQTLGFHLTPTPGTAEACPTWMHKGFFLYEQLQALGYQFFQKADSERCLLETHADAVFWRLLKGKLLLPISLEGRLQRQLVLYSHNLPVADAMDFFIEITRHKLLQGELPDKNIHTHEELNALAAAHISWLAFHKPGSLELIGEWEQGKIALTTSST